MLQQLIMILQKKKEVFKHAANTCCYLSDFIDDLINYILPNKEIWYHQLEGNNIILNYLTRLDIKTLETLKRTFIADDIVVTGQGKIILYNVIKPVNKIEISL